MSYTTTALRDILEIMDAGVRDRRDIITRLRALADEIERGEPIPSVNEVAVDELQHCTGTVFILSPGR